MYLTGLHSLVWVCRAWRNPETSTGDKAFLGLAKKLCPSGLCCGCSWVLAGSCTVLLCCSQGQTLAGLCIGSGTDELPGRSTGRFQAWFNQCILLCCEKV